MVRKEVYELFSILFGQIHVAMSSEAKKIICQVAKLSFSSSTSSTRSPASSAAPWLWSYVGVPGPSWHVVFPWEGRRARPQGRRRSSPDEQGRWSIKSFVFRIFNNEIQILQKCQYRLQSWMNKLNSCQLWIANGQFSILIWMSIVIILKLSSCKFSVLHPLQSVCHWWLLSSYCQFSITHSHFTSSLSGLASLIPAILADITRNLY